jgi:hypothetical protein
MQLALTYSAAHAGEDLWQRQLRWLRQAVDLLGHKHVAAELDVAPSQLTDALLERERKDIKARWVAKVLLMVPESMRREWFAIECPTAGFEIPQPQKTRTAEERLAEIERQLMDRFGDAGRAFLAEVRR